MNENREMTREEREVWIKSKIEYLANVFTNPFLFFALTPFTKDRPKDLTLKAFLVIVFSTDNSLRREMEGQMLKAGISSVEVREVFALLSEKDDFLPASREKSFIPDLSGHGHIYGDLDTGRD